MLPAQTLAWKLKEKVLNGFFLMFLFFSFILLLFFFFFFLKNICLFIVFLASRCAVGKLMIPVPFKFDRQGL